MSEELENEDLTDEQKLQLLHEDIHKHLKELNEEYALKDYVDIVFYEYKDYIVSYKIIAWIKDGNSKTTISKEYDYEVTLEDDFIEKLKTYKNNDEIEINYFHDYDYND